MTYTVQPITDRTWIGSKPKTHSRFDTTWSKTISLLHKEIAHLGARDFVIQMDIDAADLRLDGELRANAKPKSDAVVVTFESKHGSLTYRSDQYTTYGYQGPAWQHNVRAIALTLEALRSVDRYGATETGQQYAGFKALGAGRAMPSSHMTRDDAIRVIDEYAGGDWSLAADGARVFKLAQIATHPDKNGGDHAKWNRVEAAGVVLGLRR